MAAVAANATTILGEGWPRLKSSGLRQFQLVPSGSQGWFSRTIGGGGDHFAYASTLAVYVYRLSDFTLSSVLTGHQRTITGLAWNLKDPNQFATLGSDSKMVLWDVAKGSEVLSKTLPHNAFVADFNPSSADKMAFACENKVVYMWDTRTNDITRLFASGKSSARCLRWSERRSNILAVGCKNGQVLLHDTTSQATVELLAGGVDASPVADLRWDRLSADYLLVAFRDGTLILVDVESRGEVQRFEKQGAAITALEWLPRQPGAFASINGRAGVIRVWNVSQRAPLEVVKVSDRPAFGMCLLPDGHSLAMTFLDGAVAVYDTATRALRHRGLPGHIETIFDVAFHPVDADTLATASYDASVKVWNAPSMRCAQTLTADTGPLYSVAWSPDGSKITASSGKGRLVVWDVSTGAVLWLNSAAHPATSLRVAWSHLGRQHLATGGMDRTLAVWDTVHQRLVTRISHPGDVMGCAWSPVDPELVATACSDGMVRLFSFRSSRPMLEVRAHASRAFNVQFSPTRPSLIASTGDDNIVAVVDATTSRVVKLRGHKNKVRALCWHPEFHGIVLTGGWDGLICVFDAIAGTCLQSHRAHDADIYGLSVHPLRPFTAVSSSRDTSLRFWHLRPPSHAHRALVLKVLVDPCVLQSLCLDATTLPASAAGPSAASGGGGALAPMGFCGPGSRRAVALMREALGLGEAEGGRLRPGTIDWGLPPASSASDGLARSRVYAAVGSLHLDADGGVDLWRLVVRAAEAKAGVLLAASSVGHGQSLGGAGRAAASGRGGAGACGHVAGASATSSSGSARRDPKALRALFGGVGANGDGAGGDLAAAAGAALPPEVGDGLRLGSGVPPVLWSEDAAAAAADRALRADAVRLGMASTGLGGPTEAEFMDAAARLYLQQGNIRRYCDVLTATGRWDEALAVAPAAGLAFWRELAAKRAASLASDGTARALPFLVATGDVDGAASLLVSRSEGDAAVAMQQAVATGAWDSIIRVTSAALRGRAAERPGAQTSAAPASGSGEVFAGPAGSAPAGRSGSAASPDPVESDVALARERAKTRRDRTARQLAEREFARGSACRAAAHALAVGDARLAVQYLERGGLQLMAFSVARALDVQPRLGLAVAVSRLLQREGLWRASLELLEQERCPAVDVAMTAAEFGGPEARLAAAAAAIAAGVPTSLACPVEPDVASATASLYEECGIRSRGSWATRAAGLVSAGRHVEAVSCLVASRNWAGAAVAGLRVMRLLLLRGAWDGVRLRRLAAVLSHIDATLLPPRRRARLLAYCALVGGLTAVDRGSMTVAAALFRVFRRLVEGSGLLGMGVSGARVACIEARALLGHGRAADAARLLQAHGKPADAAATRPNGAPQSHGAAGHASGATTSPGAAAGDGLLDGLPEEGGGEDDEDEAEEAEIANALLEDVQRRAKAGTSSSSGMMPLLPPPSEFDDDDLVRRLLARATAESKQQAKSQARPAAASSREPMPKGEAGAFVPEGSKLPRAGSGDADAGIDSGTSTKPLAAATAAAPVVEAGVDPEATSSAALSVISGRPVVGPCVLLSRDGQCCDVAEALEWAACCAFSPLADGTKALSTME